MGIVTAATDFATAIRLWAARPDYDDTLVDSFIRTAESNLSRVMRVKEMITISDAVLTANKAPLPTGWRDLEYVRLNDGKPLKYLTNDEFWAENVPLKNRYTIVGDTIIVGADTSGDGLAVEIAAYMAAPHLTDDATWLYTYYYDIFLQACKVTALIFGEEDEKAMAAQTYVEALIAGANEEHARQKVSGSPLRVPLNRGRLS